MMSFGSEWKGTIAMIKLRNEDIKDNTIKSSKGNQMKWFLNNVWYKADYVGYEGFSEYLVSKLVKFSNLKETEFTDYECEEIEYQDNKFAGCKSKNFMPVGWQLITLERLFMNYYGHSLNSGIYSIESYENRAKFIVDQTIRMTNLKDFGIYFSVLMTIDAFFLNEDRHTHNIAVLLDEKGVYHYCPIFDNGASLLSDTKLDYPLSRDVFSLMRKVKPKTFSDNFDVQLDAVEKLYGKNVHFSFTRKDVEEIVDRNVFYSREIKDRVKNLIFEQMRKYKYLLIK
ncbi:MAG: hypothetical protein FD179_1536 [Erysipelotrichaceae bacterium]|nr:MAG: hypothetical protein FD179_1536 [Erysipelotrichaceae bacterium]